MHAKVFSATILGIDGCLIEVEVDLAMGFINFCIVGLPDKAVNESKDRIRAALKNCGLKMPERLVTVNLAPAHIKKQDTLFDVPIAIAILQAAKQLDLPPDFLAQTVVLGELSLDGSIRPVTGVIAIAQAALKAGMKRLIVPCENVVEATAIEGLKIYGVSHLNQLVNFLRGQEKIAPAPFQPLEATVANTVSGIDFSQVKGQFEAKRALEIGAAGWHNVLFLGPPGAGKTMLAERVPTIMPPMNFHEAVETSKIYSVAGLMLGQGLLKSRPFCNPHHTISKAGLVGGGTSPKPGQISLAQNGVLFLDELTEFNRCTLESLRQPLENGSVCIARVNFSVEYPANFLLIAATNPCPCGYAGDASNRCNCSHLQAQKYFSKLSGPLIDRIDLHVRVKNLTFTELAGDAQVEATETSAVIKSRVLAAQEFARKRQGNILNAHLNVDQINEFCVLSPEGKELLAKAFTKLSLSARSYHRILRVSRTIADLAASPTIEPKHVREAIMLRLLDKQTATS